MPTGGYGQTASGCKNQIMLSLCAVVVCLETVILSPAQEPISPILLSFNLATCYALVMASIFAPGTMMKGIAARMSAVSAALSVLLVVTRELACKVQTFHGANGASSFTRFG